MAGLIFKHRRSLIEYCIRPIWPHIHSIDKTIKNLAYAQIMLCVRKRKLSNFSNQKSKMKLSYWKAAGSEPLKSLTVHELLSATVQKYGDREAIISLHQGEKLTFNEVYKHAQNLAYGLLDIGLKKGDHVGLLGSNTVEWYLSLLASISAGFVVVNLNPLLEANEIERSLKNVDVKAIIMEEEYNHRWNYEMLKKVVPEISQQASDMPVKTNLLPSLSHVIIMSDVIYPGAYRWQKILENGSINYNAHELHTIQNSINEHDSCNIQFTSGTTTTPKGALLSHYNVVNNSYFFSKRLLLSEKHHKICFQVPLFHTFGTVLGVLASLHHGTTLVMPSRKFSPAKSVEAIIHEKCTFIYGTPTMYFDIITVVNNVMKIDPSILSKIQSLEGALTAGALCPTELFKRMKKMFGFKRIYSAYGMTEASPVTFVSLPTDSEFQVTSTVGCVADHTEVKVINEKGEIIPIGSPGEVCFKGYMVMKGYYNDVECTKKTIIDGWLHSGDRFILLENGYGQVIGRIKETIIRGGENIEPSDIENFIITHPDVINVQVFAVNDNRLGEAVAAAIIKKENSSLTEEDVYKYCNENIARYKIPKHIKFVSSFPLTASGKVQKFILRKQLEDELKLTSNII